MGAERHAQTQAGVMELVDVADSKSADGDIVGVRVPPPAPCKDDYFDTMGIEIIVLTFCLKPLKTAKFLTFLKKAVSDLAENRAGDGAFYILGLLVG